MSDYYSMSEIVEAVSRGDEEFLQLFIESGANVNMQINDPMNDCSKASLLILASHLGWITISSMLIDAGADPNLQDTYSRTALFHAIICGRPRIVSLLIDAGADTDKIHFMGSALPLIAYIDNYSFSDFVRKNMFPEKILALLLREYPKVHLKDNGDEELEQAYNVARYHHYRVSISIARNRNPIVNLKRHYRLF